jgi:hypothetical protein
MAEDTTEPTPEQQPATAPEADQPAPDAAAEEDAAAKRSEAAKKGAETRAANQKQAAIIEDLYKHIRHTVGAEISIGQAQQIVEMVQNATAAE